MQVGQIPMAPVSHELTEPGYTYGNPYAKLPEYEPSSYGRADDHDASLSFLQQGTNQQIPGAFTKPLKKAAAMAKKISPAGKLGDMSGKIMSQPSSVPPSPTSIQD